MIILFIFPALLTAAVLGLAAKPAVFFRCAVRRPYLFILNAMPLYLLTLLFFSAAGRLWLAFAAVSAVALPLALVHRFKVLIREEPFLPSDFTLIREAAVFSGAAKGHSSVLEVAIPAVTVVMAALSAYFGNPVWSGDARLITAAGVIVAFCALNRFIYRNGRLFRSGPAGGSPYKLADLCESRGFLYSFWHHMNKLGVVRPDGYSVSRAAQILAPYGRPKLPPEALAGEWDGLRRHPVNVVFVMGEAFTELSDEPFFTFEQDILAPYKQLKDEGFHGT
ncbi:MAG: hypothetical protein LBH95_01910, partial [Oscillospiraceae bacterium]|nr:hypothetical protein [Oscillospiraceae bacterium]